MRETLSSLATTSSAIGPDTPTLTAVAINSYDAANKKAFTCRVDATGNERAWW